MPIAMWGKELGRSPRKEQKKIIAEAIVQEMMVLKQNYKSLPAELLRARALKNLRIPSTFGNTGTTVDWSKIGSRFVMQPGTALMDTSTASTAYEGERKFFKNHLPRKPDEQYSNVARVEVAEKSLTASGDNSISVFHFTSDSSCSS